MPHVTIARRARAQITETLRYTLREFGESKRQEYRDLIRKALVALAENPKAGKRHPEIHPDAWTYHIARHGQRARHLFIYRIGKDYVEIARFLHDAMELERHLPENWTD